jgi:8-oxo-dGTP diphosphatase
MDEDLPDAARRELFEETGLRKLKLIEFGAFGHPRRDPRGRTITVAYLALVRKEKVKPRAGDDAAAVGWFPAHKPPELAFDHELELKGAWSRLCELAVLTPALFELLPATFSAQELKDLCAEIFQIKSGQKQLLNQVLSLKLIRPASAGRFRAERKKFAPGSLSFLIANRV